MDPGIRASDADRERVAAELQEHLAAGRLSIAEFGDRAAAAYRSRTIGELQRLTGDLPPSQTGRRWPGTGAVAAAGAVVLIVVLLLGFILAPGATGLGGLAAQMQAMCGMA